MYQKFSVTVSHSLNMIPYPLNSNSPGVQILTMKRPHLNPEMRLFQTNFKTKLSFNAISYNNLNPPQDFKFSMSTKNFNCPVKSKRTTYCNVYIAVDNGININNNI